MSYKTAILKLRRIDPRRLLYTALFIAAIFLALNINFSYLLNALMSSQAEVSYDYYVSPDGSDSNAGSDKNYPLRTIQYALENAQPGESVYLLPGQYYQDLVSVRDGRAGAPIKIVGARDAVVHGGGNDRVFEIHHDHITLDGFTMDGLHGDSDEKKGYRDMLIYAVGTEDMNGVTGLKILNMEMKNAGGECIRLKYFAQDNEVAYNTISNCGVYDFRFNDGGKNGEAVYIGTAPEQLYKNPTDDLDHSNNNYIHHNIMDTQGNEGVDIKEGSEYNLVEYNVVSGQRDPDSSGLGSRGDHNIFRYNEVYGSTGAGIRFGGDDYDGRAFGKYNEAYGNKLVNNEYGAIKVQVKPQGNICGNELSGNGSGTGTYGDEYDYTAQCGDGLGGDISYETSDPGNQNTPSSEPSGPDSTANICYMVCETAAAAGALPVSGVSASTYDEREGGHTPANTLDDNLGTRWSGEGDGAWIQFDLGGEKTVSYLEIAFYKGDQRAQKFDIAVSADGTAWNKVYGGQSGGSTLDAQRFDLTAAFIARYVRIIGHGNTQNDWNSLTEVRVFGI